MYPHATCNTPIYIYMYMFKCCIFTCEKSAKAGSANSGAWPISSWQTSGSGVYNGMDGCLMYWVAWKTRNARPAKKSRDDSRPATGLSWNPVRSLRNLETTSSCGILSSLQPAIYRYKGHATLITDLPITAVFHQKRKVVIVFLTGMCWVQFSEFLEYCSPINVWYNYYTISI